MADGATDTQLVTIPKANALEIFTTPEMIDPILARIRQQLDEFKPDLSTASGRKAIASIAYKVAQSKTYLDGVGKELVTAQKEIPNKIDASRKRIRDTLDAWKDEVRKPLTDWEVAEEARVNRIKADLAELQSTIDDRTERSAEEVRDRLAEVRAEAITEERWNEYVGAAAELKDKAIAALEAALMAAEKREAEAAELARLRAEAAERERVAREEQAKREAEERERKAAEAAAAAERAKAEAAARAAQQEAERKEREHKAALEAAERRAVEAAAKAKAEVEEAAQRELAEKAKREADREYRATINRAALAAFVDGGLTEETAKQVVTLIAAGSIPAVSINY
jgi:hypothetical protein